ncbi:hypothetical protein [Cochleicola gelatinilyticus]|uniref:Secreted protein n=1 Tax=Cochleicola gelatinilyticus TaxID=1763537 RepID=A0A167GYM1_9FLAO|nr:hypothetical protein [Cochleicola gelatinilyticus]OAB78039.1 hypothetical protein ULVI_11175 [Cochleicola gelatinilyticus]
MKTVFIYLFLVCFGITSVMAQFDNSSSNTPRFEANENNYEEPTGFELPAIKTPRVTNDRRPYTSTVDPNLGENKEAPVDFTKGDGLLDYKTDTAPKYFTKDKSITDEIGGDQYLGDFKTKAGHVTIAYRDHEFVDGDRVRIFVNDDVVRGNVSLGGNFRGFKLPLQSGFNRIDFQALNQGDSGPNTAQLRVYDDDGSVLASHEWNLLTGNTATIIVVKD